VGRDRHLYFFAKKRVFLCHRRYDDDLKHSLAKGQGIFLGCIFIGGKKYFFNSKQQKISCKTPRFFRTLPVGGGVPFRQTNLISVGSILFSLPLAESL